MRDLAKDSRWLQRQEPNRDNHISVNFYRAYDWLNQAIRAEAEVERLKQMVKSITGGLDEVIETNQYLEAELAKYKRAYAEICHQYNFGNESDYIAMYNYWLDWAEKEGE
jgi:uncharacterized protein YeeX (DUF496 family)